MERKVISGVVVMMMRYYWMMKIVNLIDGPKSISDNRYSTNMLTQIALILKWDHNKYSEVILSPGASLYRGGE